MKLSLYITFVISTLFSNVVLAQTEHIGIIIKSSGDAFVVREETEKFDLKRRDKIFEGDRIITSGKSTLQIRFIDKAMLALRENSEIIIEQYHSKQDQQEEKVFMELLSGGFRTITGNFGKASEDGYEVKTPAASIGIRGTDYEAVLAGGGELALGVWSGGISVANDSGKIDLGGDTGFSFGTVKKNASPKGSLTPPESLNQKVEMVEEESEETEEKTNSEESESESDESETDSKQSNQDQEDATEDDNKNSDEEQSNNQTSEEGNQNDETDVSQPITENANTKNTTVQSEADISSPIPLNLPIIESITTIETTTIEQLIKEPIKTETAGNTRLTGNQIEQIKNNPNIGMVFFAEDLRKPIYAPVLQSNVELHLQNFGHGIKPATFISENPWKIIEVENGSYATESISIHYMDKYAMIDLNSNSENSLIDSMQSQMDSYFGIGSMHVLINDAGHLVIQASDSSDSSFSIDTTSAINFSNDLGISNSTFSTLNFDNNVSFNISVKLNGVEFTYPIKLDKSHVSVNDLINDINEDLPADAKIIVRQSETGIEFIAMSTSENSNIQITNIQGNDESSNQLTAALGGITENQPSAIAQSNDGQSMHFGYVLENPDGTITFITYENESTDVLNGEFLDPEFVLNGGSSVTLERESNIGGHNNISWGYWNLSEENQATLTPSLDSEEQPQSFSDRLYFIDASPAKAGQLVGQKTFNSTGDFLGSSDAGDVTQISGSMQVDFSNAKLTGNLNVEVGLSQNWNVQYEGQVNNATVQMSNVWGAATFDDGTQHDASGEMGGIFADPGDTYVGGFNLQTTDNSEHHVEGVYLMEEDAAIEMDQ